MSSRRALLAGAAALVVPLPAQAGVMANLAISGESLPEKVDRLTRELSHALSGYLNGTFRAVVEPEASRYPVQLQSLRSVRKDQLLLQFLKSAEPRDLAQHHLKELGTVMQRDKGGRWDVYLRYDADYALVVGHPEAAYQGMIQHHD
jgi:hypothetical protein